MCASSVYVIKLTHLKSFYIIILVNATDQEAEGLGPYNKCDQMASACFLIKVMERRRNKDKRE